MDSLLCLLMEAFFFWDQDVYVSRAKVEETGSKNSASGLLGVIVSDATPRFLDPNNLGYKRKNTIYWMLVQNIHSLLGNLAQT